jgi:hypothetical protein
MEGGSVHLAGFRYTDSRGLAQHHVRMTAAESLAIERGNDSDRTHRPFGDPNERAHPGVNRTFHTRDRRRSVYRLEAILQPTSR